MTYIFITHDLSVAKYMSDRILVMREGQIVENGAPQQLFLNPKHAYTRSLIEAIPRVEPGAILAAREKRAAFKAGLV